MAGAALVSAALNLGLVCAAGGLIALERPEILRLDVDLRLLAPPSPEPPVPAPRPAPEKKVKKPRPKPVIKSARQERPDQPPEPAPEKVAQMTPPAPMDAAHEQAAPPQPAPAVSPDWLPDYKKLVRQKINRARRKISWERNERDYDNTVVKVKFVISASGSVSEIRVVKGTGFEVIDQAAINTILRAAPFPPLPEGVPRLTLTVPIRIRVT
jgi:protein TonB